MEEKPFAILYFYFRKPKSRRVRKAPPAGGHTINKVARYLKCMNASSMLLRSFDERHVVSKWSEQRSFPFLKRNMEVCVNAWKDCDAPPQVFDDFRPRRATQSPKTEELINYNDKMTAWNDCEATPQLRGGFRPRRVIHSPTTEDCKPAVERRAKRFAAAAAAHSRRSPRAAKSRRPQASVRVKVEADEELAELTPITRHTTQKRRSARLNASCMSAATADAFAPPATRRRTVLAIEALASPSSTKIVARKKRWNKTEMDRLKVAMRAVGDPRSLEDWVKIANSISAGERSAEECREQAVKLRYWKPPADEASGAAGGSGDADAENRPRQKPSNSKADFFADKSYGDITLLGLDPDDSLLSVLKTPTEPVKYARKPPLLRQIINETIYSTRSSFNDSI